MFPRPAFFQDARLNFAENLLYPKCNPDENSFAVIEANESTRNHVTWRELRGRVREISVALRNLGIKKGDCVFGFVANHCNALLAMLASTSMGAIWTASKAIFRLISSCSRLFFESRDVLKERIDYSPPPSLPKTCLVTQMFKCRWEC